MLHVSFPSLHLFFLFPSFVYLRCVTPYLIRILGLYFIFDIHLVAKLSELSRYQMLAREKEPRAVSMHYVIVYLARNRLFSHHSAPSLHSPPFSRIYLHSRVQSGSISCAYYDRGKLKSRRSENEAFVIADSHRRPRPRLGSRSIRSRPS